MITSSTNKQVKNIIKLQRNAKTRREQDLFIAEGIKLVAEAGKYGEIQQIYIAQHFQETFEKEGMRENFWKDVPVEVLTDSIFAELSETVTPQGILAIVKLPCYDWETFLGKDEQTLLLLDGIQDPGNLGTIMRTAEGAGINGIIMSKDTVDLFNPKVVRSTMGSIFRMPFFQGVDILQVMKKLKDNSYTFYGAALDGAVSYDTITYAKKTALIIGNEANGITGPVLEQIDVKALIPMEGNVESLNAAVAAGIFMYEISRQRRNLKN